MPINWYAIDKHGRATLCANKDDANLMARQYAAEYPLCAPYRAAQLVEVPAGWRVVPPWNNWDMRAAMRKALPSIPGDILDHALAMALENAPEPPR